MAEILGVVASGMSVVSLAIQVAESINKLKSFYSLMQSAPSEIAFLLDELETLSLILEDLDRSVRNEVFLNPSIKTAVMRSYRLCRNSGEALAALALELEEGLKNGKKRGGFKVAMKKDKIEEFRKKLETAKSTMLLANQCYNQAISQQKWESHERDMIQITTALSQISSSAFVSSECESGQRERHKSETSLMARSDMRYTKTRNKARPATGTKSVNATKRLFGQLEIVLLNEGLASKASVSLSLPAWIYARRYQFRLSKSYQGWQQSLQSYAIFSYDDLVFKYSMDGNVSGLQELFQVGKASPFVVDPDGRSPLHYAALYARPEACLFLVENGADCNLRTSWKGEFGLQQCELGKGWYPLAGLISRKDIFRGWPAYSTPLHFLSSVTGDLIDNGRAALTDIYATSDQDVMEDVRKTLEVLVWRGRADPFLKDQFDMTVFHSYKSLSGDIKWLRRQFEEELEDMDRTESLELSAFRVFGMYDSLGETFYDFLPEGKITNEVATYKFGNGNGWTILGVVASMHTLFPSKSTDYKKLVQELVAAGSDVHAISEEWQQTIILEVIESLARQSRKSRINCIKTWLGFLYTAGVDLVEYGRVEDALHDEGKISWVFETDIGDEYDNICQFELMKLQIGETPDDFCIELEDLYVSAGLAADFWVWAEGPSEEDMIVPGAWTDD